MFDHGNLSIVSRNVQTKKLLLLCTNCLAGRNISEKLLAITMLIYKQIAISYKHWNSYGEVNFKRFRCLVFNLKQSRQQILIASTKTADRVCGAFP